MTQRDRLNDLGAASDPPERAAQDGGKTHVLETLGMMHSALIGWRSR